MKSVQVDKEMWFFPWTYRGLLWVLIAFIVAMILETPFIFFFDTVLTMFGFMYVYFWVMPQAAILYFVAFKLRIRWTSTVIMGLMGIVGAPIDYYFEWVAQQNLLGPVYAFLYIPLFVFMGVSADISFMNLHPGERPIRASSISALIFTVITLVTIAFATFQFYPEGQLSGGTWLSFGDFLIPYSLVTGVLGGYLGFSLARDTDS